MKIYSRYLAFQVIKMSLLVLFVLLAISLFFTAIQQIDILGKKNFGLSELFYLLLLKSPAMIYDFTPVALLIGSLLGLGGLAAHSEMIALQAAGLRTSDLIYTMSLASLVFILVTLLMDNFIVSDSERAVVNLTQNSSAKRVTEKTENSVWIKQDAFLLNLESLLPGKSAGKAMIFQLDERGQLEQLIHAESVQVGSQGFWQLDQMTISQLSSQSINQQKLGSLEWDSGLSSTYLQSIASNPRYMSLMELNELVTQLRQNGMVSKAEEIMFWKKIVFPLNVLLMGLLAIPFVIGLQRSASSGYRILIGIMLGLGYVITNKLLLQIGDYVSVSPLLNATLPTLLFMLVTLFLYLKRSR